MRKWNIKTRYVRSTKKPAKENWASVKANVDVMPECTNGDGDVDEKGASRSGAVQVQYCRSRLDTGPSLLVFFFFLALIFTH